MTKEIFQAIEGASLEKGVSKEVIFDAMESALASATKRRYDEDAEFRVAIDRETGDYETFRVWTVVDVEQLEEPLNPAAELTPEDPRAAGLEIGDTIEMPVESVAFGRIAAQTAKQVIVQKVREAERARVFEEYTPKVGQLVGGAVKRVGRDNVIVDLGNNAEGLLTREHLIPRETFRIGERVRAMLVELRPENRGPQLMLSRTSPEMLAELFKIEVPEISEDIIQIRGAARDPGSRAKIAVSTNDGRIDPVGACVGMRGSRVQAVSGELAGERIDIVPWNDNPAQLTINAMAPAEVAYIQIDEDAHTMNIAVAEDKLAQAIGKGGQNVRLASDLTGWTLNIMTEQEAADMQEAEAVRMVEDFMESLSVDENVATVLSLSQPARLPRRGRRPHALRQQHPPAVCQRRRRLSPQPARRRYIRTRRLVERRSRRDPAARFCIENCIEKITYWPAPTAEGTAPPQVTNSASPTSTRPFPFASTPFSKM